MSLPDPEHDGLGFLLSDVSRSLRRVFQKRSAGSALTLAQSRLLVHVSRQEGIRQVQLAEILEVQPISLARLIDQLVKARVVERRADPTDRRAFRIFLTKGARAHLQAIQRVAAEVRREALKGTTQAEARTLIKVLKSMRHNLASR